MTRLQLKSNAVFLPGIACVMAVVFVVTWYARTIDQQSAVQRLSRDALDGRPLCVWYSNDFIWNANAGQFELVFRFDPTLSFKGWVAEYIGRDFAYSPIAITTDRKLWPEDIEAIRSLPSLRQIFSRNQQECTNDQLRELFPHLIIADVTSVVHVR
jgi:hypothetical protein